MGTISRLMGVMATGESTLKPVFMLTCSGKRRIDSLLKHRNITLNIQNKLGQTPLILAAQFDFSTLESLLQKEVVDVNAQDEDGNTALHHAIQNRGKRRIEALLKHENVNSNLRNKMGQTPLHLAWNHPETKVMRLLKDKGADDTIRDTEGRTPQEFFESQRSYMFNWARVYN